MRHGRTIRYALLLTFAILAPIVFSSIPHAHGAGTTYYLTPVPVFTQEGLTITLVLTVVSALPSTPYQFSFIVRDPSGRNWTSTLQSHNTTAVETQFSILLVYPSTSFPGRNSLVGQYNAQVNQVRPIPTVNVASTHFFILLTNLTEYQRTETVNIRASGYNSTESTTVTIRTFTTSTLVFSSIILASSTGIVTTTWKIPRNATIDNYIVTVTSNAPAGMGTAKTPPDVHAFGVNAASISISTLSSSKSSYYRTETMKFSFQPVYPDGTAATTGVALLNLMSASRANVTLTATYNSTSQSFEAVYKTSVNNATGTWTTTLAARAYGDGYGNTGPPAPLSNSPQLVPATFTINIMVNTYFAIGQPIRFNATVAYPDGTLLQSGTVSAFLVYAGSPPINQTVPVVFDSGLGLWVGNHPRGSNEPGGLWSLTVKASDSSIPPNTGSATRAITLQDTPPVASFSSSSTSVLIPNPITFNATASYDPDGTIVTYSWTFGDGGTNAGPIVTHLYTLAGTYTVTLTVTDNSGTTASSTVTVIVSQRTSTTTVSCTPLTVSLGQSLSCSARVSDTSPGTPSTPTGTVTFTPSGTCILAGSGATASCTTTVTPAMSGTVSISASYAGDTAHATNNGATTITVQGAPPSGNLSVPLFYFGILAAVVAALLIGAFLAFRRHRVTHAKLKIDLEAVKSEAGRIENQEFFQSVKDQLKKDKE